MTRPLHLFDMSDEDTLEAVLDNRQIPHQPFVVITDSPVFPGLPVLRDVVRRNIGRRSPSLIVSLLRPPGVYLSASHARAPNTELLDLTELSYDTVGDEASPVERIIIDAYQSLPHGSQTVIDAVDLLAEDQSPSFALKLIRRLMDSVKAAKAPTRLILLIPHASPFLQHILSPTLSPSLTMIHPLHPQLVSQLSRLYLAPVQASPSFWQILESAKQRRTPEDLAYRAQDDVEVIGDWSDPSSSVKGAVIQVVVRKTTGGTKGITRSLSAVTPSPTGLSVRPVSDLISINPVDAPSILAAVERPPAAPEDLFLPFSLNLSDEQKRRRGEVPLPYAHEGEGVGLDWEEDDDDDEEV